MYRPWTLEEKQKMIADYRRAHIARCPIDRSILRVQDPRTQREPDDDPSVEFIVQCLTCRQGFYSRNVR